MKQKKSPKPDCFGQFSKCPLRKKFVCGWHDPKLPEECRQKEEYNMYLDEKGVLWVCG